jgi:predicted Zn-ribbon and HTH transcriptional regulator
MLSETLLNIAKKRNLNPSTASLRAFAKCYICGKPVEDWDEKQKLAPRCNRCKSLLRK